MTLFAHVNPPFYLWPCYEQCSYSLCKCPCIIYLSNIIVPSLKEVEWGEHRHKSFPFPPFFKCNKYFLSSPPPFPFPFPHLETCQELGSLRWAIEGTERVIHTEPGFFVLHHKVCCWPALLSTLPTRTSWEIQLADSRSSGNRTTEVTLWGKYSPMSYLGRRLYMYMYIYCFLMYLILKNISGVVWRH